MPSHRLISEAQQLQVWVVQLWDNQVANELPSRRWGHVWSLVCKPADKGRSLRILLIICIWPETMPGKVNLQKVSPYYLTRCKIRAHDAVFSIYRLQSF